MCDAIKINSIPIPRQFLLPDHNFETDFKLTIIEQISNTNMTKERRRHLLLQGEDFLIKKLETL